MPTYSSYYLYKLPHRARFPFPRPREEPPFVSTTLALLEEAKSRVRVAATRRGKEHNYTYV